MEKVRMLSTLGLMGAMRSLSSSFEAATGIHVDADFAPTLALLKRLRDGEAADLVILTREGLDEVLAEGRVLANGAADLAFLAVQIAQDQVDFKRIARAFGGLRELVDRLIDLVGDEEVEPQHVMR